MDVSKSDVLSAIRFLEDAAALYRAGGNASSPAVQNRIRLINNLTRKLKSKIPNQNGKTKSH